VEFSYRLTAINAALLRSAGLWYHALTGTKVDSKVEFPTGGSGSVSPTHRVQGSSDAHLRLAELCSSFWRYLNYSGSFYFIHRLSSCVSALVFLVTLFHMLCRISRGSRQTVLLIHTRPHRSLHLNHNGVLQSGCL
jgi:hypothetical protein